MRRRSAAWRTARESGSGSGPTRSSATSPRLPFPHSNLEIKGSVSPRAPLQLCAARRDDIG